MVDKRDFEYHSNGIKIWVPLDKSIYIGIYRWMQVNSVKPFPMATPSQANTNIVLEGVETWHLPSRTDEGKVQTTN